MNKYNVVYGGENNSVFECDIYADTVFDAACIMFDCKALRVIDVALFDQFYYNGFIVRFSSDSKEWLLMDGHNIVGEFKTLARC